MLPLINFPFGALELLFSVSQPKPRYTGPKAWTKQVKAGTKFGRVLGGVGLGLTAYDIYDGGLNTSNSLDAAFGVIAFIPGGAIISGAYFVTNLITIGITGQSIGEHFQESITGNGTKAWKTW